LFRFLALGLSSVLFEQAKEPHPTVLGYCDLGASRRGSTLIYYFITFEIITESAISILKLSGLHRPRLAYKFFHKDFSRKLNFNRKIWICKIVTLLSTPSKFY